ncbi:MAG: hypothetical protein ACJ788_14660, partial [Ktedonobacteraceae bacterium]
MHKPPPGADEHRNKSPQRRKRQAIPPSPQETPYYADEHPEIPKVRRASLYVDQAALRQQANQEEDEQEDLDERAQPQHTGQTPPPRSPRRETNKISVVQKKRNRVYAPPPPARHTRPRVRHRRSLSHQLIYGNPAIIIGTLLLLIFIVGAIIINAARSQPPGSSISSSTVTPGTQQVGSPHELVISPTDTDHPSPPVFATSAYLLDADTGATLYAHNPFMHLPMLSTTKLMTAVLAIEHGNLDQKITITNAINN